MPLLSVASFTDAWIETDEVVVSGLSVTVASFTDAWIETLLSAQQWHAFDVASFTDAWIETIKGAMINVVLDKVASFTDAWIETPGGIAKKLLRSSHLLQMRGLKHRLPLIGFRLLGRIFYRCVD